jgi:nitrogenase molybdenum-iron protein alpha/beta subunit
MDKSACIDPYVRCAFYGACQTAFGFENACIIAHSPQGCQLSADVAFRWQQADYTLTEVLCSKLCEDEIVHGGEDTLRRTIADAENYDVPLVMVVSACGPEIVGDNITAVAEEMESALNFQIVPIAAPGFLGSQYKGVDIALEALLTKFKNKKEKKENTVCVIAPHASGNPTWPGDLSWIKAVFNALKVDVTSVLTYHSSLTDVYNAVSCETCIVLSHDAGMKAALLCNTEPLCKSIPLPIGFENTRQFLTQLGTRFDAEKTVEDIIEQGERTVIQQLRRRGLHVEFFNKVSTALVADNTIGIPLLRFLVQDLEMIPEVVLLRSDTQKLLAEREMKDLQISPAFACGVDVYQVKEYLKKVAPTCVVGSNIERHLARELGIPLSFEIIHPVLEYRMTDKQYFGYTGMLHLIEIIQNEWWNRWKSKKKRYKSKW